MSGTVHAKGICEVFPLLVENQLRCFAVRQPELQSPIAEWKKPTRDMDRAIHRLAQSTLLYYQSGGKPATSHISPSRMLCSRYLSLQSVEPATPAPEILRRMLEEADA